MPNFSMTLYMTAVGMYTNIDPRQSSQPVPSSGDQYRTGLLGAAGEYKQS